MSAQFIVVLLVRLGLVLLFLPFSALDKIMGFNHAVDQAFEMFKPRTLAALVILCGLSIEIVCSLGVITGIADRACALILTCYCLATGALFKRFWRKATSGPVPMERAGRCFGFPQEHFIGRWVSRHSCRR